jgi:integral membrane protein (TIGR01906 family)
VSAIAIVLPLVLLADGVDVLLQPWFIRFEYHRSGFPPDEFGMQRPERTRLALAGLRSILPWDSEGIARLERARLAGGEPAFGQRELRHMRHVRRLLVALLTVQAVAAAALVAFAIRRRTRPLVRDGLRAGSLATLGLGALVGSAYAINPVGFLTGFHTAVFFSGSSWRFADTDTLRRLYPDRFWEDTTVLLAGGTALQALLLLVVTGGFRRRRTIPPCRTGS